MAIDTTDRRRKREEALDDSILDVVIDIQDASKKLSLTEREQLLGQLKGVSSGIVIDPSSIVSGKTPLALGAGPAPKPADPKKDLADALSGYATANGIDPHKVEQLLAVIDTPEKLANATSAAEGRMVPKSQFTDEQTKSATFADRLKDVEAHLGVPSGQLCGAGNGWKAAIDAARPPAGRSALAGRPTTEDAALASVLKGLSTAGKLGGGDTILKGSLPRVTVEAWLDSKGL